MIRTWLLLFFTALCYQGNAQRYVNYSEQDGLPSNHVYKITQDIKGFIWIATDEGLVKYNGSEFKVFTTKDGLPTNDIWNMFPATDGKIWYMSKSASLGYILDDIVYDFKNKKENESLNPIYTGFTGKEVILNSDNKAYLLNKSKKWEEIININIANQQSVYGLIHSKYSHVINNQNSDYSLKLWSKNKSGVVIENSNFGHNSYTRAQVTDSLYYTIGTMTYGILNLNTLESKVYSFENELGINALLYGRIHLVNNELQITGEDVVARLDDLFKVKDVTHIPAAWNSHYSFIDKENTIWVATFGNGIYKYSKKEQLVKKELDNSKINDIINVKGKLIASVDGKGFYEYDSQNKIFNPFITDESFLYNAQYIPETNATYFITKNHIYTNLNNQRTQLDFEISNEVARSVTYFDGYLYAHRTNGFNKLEPYSLETIKNYELSGNSCIKSFKNHLLLGVSNGLYELKDEQVIPLKLNATFNKPVLDIIQLSSDLLLVTTNGYGAYITDLKTIQLVNATEFLKCTNPFFKDDQLYLPTNKGLYHYRLHDKKLHLKKIWNNTNGLPTNKINGVEKVGNELIVATNNGIIHLPLDYKPEQRLLDIYVDVATYKSHNLKSTNTVLYQSNSEVQFVIKNIDYRNNQKLTYEFRLLPSQTEWKNASAADLTFSELKPGNYELQLRHEYLEKSFDFSIEPRWWQSWIFYIACLLALIALIIYITKTLTKRTEALRNKELIQSKKLSELQLKALRSQMNPHFVFNSLNAIQYYINENDFETSDTYLVKFSRLVREFFELSKEQYVTVEREISLLKNYLDLECFRFKGKLTYEFEIDPTLDLKDKLPSMLLQPIVENAVNHGIFNKKTKGNIYLQFKRISSEELSISITDNGVGYIEKTKDERYKSSSVLDDRLKYLKESGNWDITMTNEKAYPGEYNIGHKVIFNLKRLVNETL